MQYLKEAYEGKHEWIIVDNALLKEMGFDNKKKYQKILTDNFTNYFEIITRTDTRAQVVTGKDRVMIAIKPEQFIESLKLVNTSEALDIIKSIEPKQIVIARDNALVYNDVALELVDNALPMMDIYNFVMTFNYDIDKLYIDKFWSGINDDTWIVIDKDLLKWIGYNCAAEASNKKLYYNILQNNFILGEDFDMIHTPVDFDERTKCEIKLKNTIIVNTRAFEMSLMMVRTRKATAIRKYFQTLGRIMKDYMMYTQRINDHNLRIENNQWKHKALEYQRINVSSDQFDIDTRPLVPNEYVYILTSNRYYRKSIFKIGKSVKPDKRIISHNTTAATDDDAMFYTHVIPTLDCGALEKTLHALLVRYHHSKEWYKLPQQYLLNIINIVVEQQNDLLTEVNSQLSTNAFNTIESIPIDAFCDKNIDTTKYNKPVSTSPKNNKQSKPILPLRRGLIYQCPICNKKSISHTKITAHIVTHTQTKK